METLITQKKYYNNLLQKLKSETKKSTLHSRKVVHISQQLDQYIIKHMEKYALSKPESH